MRGHRILLIAALAVVAVVIGVLAVVRVGDQEEPTADAQRAERV
jgi:Flp pilus assembly protein CpaB